MVPDVSILACWLVTFAPAMVTLPPPDLMETACDSTFALAATFPPTELDIPLSSLVLVPAIPPLKPADADMSVLTAAFISTVPPAFRAVLPVVSIAVPSSLTSLPAMMLIPPLPAWMLPACAVLAEPPPPATVTLPFTPSPAFPLSMPALAPTL